MKILNRFSLNLRIFIIPIILLGVGFLSILGANTLVMSKNSEALSKKELALLIDGERRPLGAGMKIIASSSNTSTAMIAVLGGDPGMMGDVESQAKLLGVEKVMVIDKNAKVIYPKDGYVAPELLDFIKKSPTTVNFSDIKTIGTDLVTFGTVYDVETFMGHLIFVSPLPKGIETIAADVTNQSDATKDESAGGLKENVEKIYSAWAVFKKQSLIWSLVMSFMSLLILFFIFYFNAKDLVSTFTNVSHSLSDSSGKVNSASVAVSSFSEQLSSASTEQVSSLVETAAAIEELSGMVQRNSENSQQAARASEQSQQAANHGKEVVEEMIQAIDDISASNNRIIEQINAGNQELEEILKVISEIENKTKVINDIVFQTKLLSFNASVEAARAGEHGKGFAVVAEEVGNLSNMSGAAAHEISGILAASITKVETIIRGTRERVDGLVTTGKQKVDKGNSTAHECGVVLSKIQNMVSEVAAMSSEISNASAEQARTVVEISKAVNQLESVTQQNSATAAESTTASEELSIQSKSLKDLVSVLVETVDGAKSAS